jgi:N-methylhydantoinase A
MVGAIRVVSVERGHDPRDFTLVAFGGAGPLHGCALAELLGISRVLVPPAPGVLCAEGLLAASLKAGFSRTMPRPEIWDGAEEVFASLEAEANKWVDEERVHPQERRTRRIALLRYEGQGSEIAITWQSDARQAFAEAHRALNGFTLEANIELVTLRIEAEGQMPAPARPALPRGTGAEPVGRQALHDASGSIEAGVYERCKLGAGDQLNGPAIVTQLDATTLVARCWRGEVLDSGALLLCRR